MKLPLSWIKEFVKLELPPIEIAKLLTSGGLEVDSLEEVSPKFEKVVTASIVKVEKHPGADKLVLADVSDGKTVHRVVCGDPKCSAGMKVAFAPEGAVLQDDEGHRSKMKKTKIRGEDSYGMLCSAKELHLSDDDSGILVFPSDTPEGLDVASLYKDVLFEISLTPNLGHCASVLGVARELSALTGKPLHNEPIALVEDAGTPIQKAVQVAVEDFEGTPRYSARLIQQLKVGPSPEWLRAKLEKSGVRSINNVVDVTNYIQLELGQPLHAFDFDRLSSKSVRVRRSKEGERFTTLDGKERVLTVKDIVICDGDTPIALAGVMGGLNSEVHAETTSVLLESALFAPSAIRQTSKRLGLSTDSSKRFERGIDPENIIEALDRAAALIQMTGGGQIASGVIDLKAAPFEKRSVDCRLSRIEALLGIHLSVNEVEMIFKRLAFEARWNGRDTFHVVVPSYRNDITQEVDLIEEVARIYGYDNIPRKNSCYHASSIPHTPNFVFEREIRRRLIGNGLQEMITCDLVGPSILNVVGDTSLPQDMVVSVLNPTSVEQSVLRTTLLPGMLQAVKLNFDHRVLDVSAFEVGRIHYQKEGKYKEQSVAGIVMTGKRHASFWEGSREEVDFYDLKGVIENLLSALHIEEISFRPSSLNTLHPGRQAAIYSGSLAIGSLGEVHPDVVRRLDVPQRIYFAEVNLKDLYQVRPKESKLKEIAIYPASERDWTVTVREDAPVQTIFDAIYAAKSSLLESVELVSIYRSERIGKNLKNLSFRFVYRDLTKTISQTAVEAEHARILDYVRTQLNFIISIT